jgi:hypothetical protein
MSGKSRAESLRLMLELGHGRGKRRNQVINCKEVTNVTNFDDSECHSTPVAIDPSSTVEEEVLFKSRTIQRFSVTHSVRNDH